MVYFWPFSKIYAKIYCRNFQSFYGTSPEKIFSHKKYKINKKIEKKEIMNCIIFKHVKLILVNSQFECMSFFLEIFLNFDLQLYWKNIMFAENRR